MADALDNALAPLAGAAVALLKTEFDAQEPALAAAGEKAGATLINAIAAKLEAARLRTASSRTSRRRRSIRSSPTSRLSSPHSCRPGLRSSIRRSTASSRPSKRN